MFEDVVETPDPVSYRITIWNSFSRSKRMYATCENDVEVPTSRRRSFWKYAQWLDELALLLLFIFMPYRLYINGHANFLMRMLGRLPPNRPTRVIIERIHGKSSISIAWIPPMDNGTDIVSYVVRCTNIRDGDMKATTLCDLPLKTSVQFDGLVSGDTYKVVVEAFNQFGLSAESSQAVYMLPLPSPQRHVGGPTVSVPGTRKTEIRNKCYICVDPKHKKLPVYALLDRRILHYCSICDAQFCHGHKGKVTHSRTLSCPAIDGKCVCILCLQKRPVSETKKKK